VVLHEVFLFDYFMTTVQFCSLYIKCNCCGTTELSVAIIMTVSSSALKHTFYVHAEIRSPTPLSPGLKRLHYHPSVNGIVQKIGVLMKFWERVDLRRIPQRTVN